MIIIIGQTDREAQPPEPPSTEHIGSALLKPPLLKKTWFGDSGAPVAVAGGADGGPLATAEFAVAAAAGQNVWTFLSLLGRRRGGRGGVIITRLG